MYLRHCCTAQGFDSTSITDSGFCSFSSSSFSSLSNSLTKYTPESSFPWVPPHTATRDNLGKPTALSTSIWLNAGTESVEEMGEIEMQGRTLLTYTPAYHTCRFLQQITEGLTLLAHSHPFNPTPKQLVPVSLSGRYPVSLGTLSTTLQNRVEISISEQLTSSLLPRQEPLRGKSRL